MKLRPTNAQGSRTATTSASTLRWFTWIAIGWVATAVFCTLLMLRLNAPDFMPVPMPSSGNDPNPVFEAVLARDVSALVAISDELQPGWLDEVHNGMTPVMQAASFGDIEMLEMLLRSGADPHKRGAGSRTALQYAAEKNRIEVAKALLEAGVDVDGADASGLTPLIMAADRNFTDLAIVLMDAGANINAAMAVGWTPLLDAAHRGNIPLTRELLRRGADVHVLINGNSAVRLAEDNGHHEVAALLREAGGRR